MKRIFAGLLSLSLTVGPLAVAGDRSISIGTGGITGVYYPAGRAICELVNEQQSGIDCQAEATGGSIYNLNAIGNGQLAFAIAQSDWQHHAYRGTAKFADKGANDKLRAVFSLHGEPFTLVVRNDSGIERLADLPGKRLNIGNPGSGQRATMEIVMDQFGWDKDSFALAAELPAADQSTVLCANKLDAVIYTVGHPNAAIKQVIANCPVRLIPVQDDRIQALLEEQPYYTAATIPAGIYPGLTEDVVTFGVKATLVTSIDSDEETVYRLTRAVFEQLERFRQMHPALGQLTAKDMLQGNSAPFHPGAIRYFKEKGLM